MVIKEMIKMHFYLVWIKIQLIIVLDRNMLSFATHYMGQPLVMDVI